MVISDRQMLDALSRTPFVDSTELALMLGEPHATVHRGLADLMAEGIMGRVNHGTAHLSSSQRYHLTAQGIKQAAVILGFDTPSDFVRAYPVSKEWLTLLIRRMDAVPSVYRLASSLSSGIDGLRSHCGVPPQGPLRRYRHPPRRPQLRRGAPGLGPAEPVSLRPAESHSGVRLHPPPRHGPCPHPSVREERLTTKFCEGRNLRDCYVAVESREALERRNLRLWCSTSWVIGSRFFSLEGVVSRASPGGGPRLSNLDT